MEFLCDIAAFISGLIGDIARYISVSWEDIGPIFLATFFGAWAAFQFQKSWEKSKQLTHDLRSGKRAQFALISQFQALKNLNKQYLSDLRDDPDRYLKLHPLTVHLEFQKVDLDSLLYVLDADNPDLLNEIMIAQQNFQTAMGVLEQRNNYHSDFQHKAAKIGDAALDKATDAILRDMTDHLYGTFDDALRLNTEAGEKLATFLNSYISLKSRVRRVFSSRKALKYKEK